MEAMALDLQGVTKQYEDFYIIRSLVILLLGPALLPAQ